MKFLFPLFAIFLTNPKLNDTHNIVMFFPTEKSDWAIRERFTEELGPKFQITVARNYSKYIEARGQEPTAYLAPGGAKAPPGYEKALIGTYNNKPYVPVVLMYRAELSLEQAISKNIAVWKFMSNRDMVRWLSGYPLALKLRLLLNVRSLLNATLLDQFSGIFIPMNKIYWIYQMSQGTYTLYNLPGFHLKTPVLMIRTDTPEHVREILISRFRNLSYMSMDYLGVNGWQEPRQQRTR